jgi:hypothetical protein
VCIGNCVHGENDYSRPDPPPSEPIQGIHYARTDSRNSGNIYGVGATRSSLRSELVAAIELDRMPSRQNSFARSTYQRHILFSVNESNRMVFDFDANVYLRTLGQGDIQDTRLTARTLLQIVIEDSANNVVFRFSPEGDGDGNVGANVISAPFPLKGDVTAIADSLTDRHRIGTGQFRAISPPLSPGEFYQLMIEHESEVVTTLVPEPCSIAIAFSVLGVPVRCRMRSHRPAALAQNCLLKNARRVC